VLRPSTSWRPRGSRGPAERATLWKVRKGSSIVERQALRRSGLIEDVAFASPTCHGTAELQELFGATAMAAPSSSHAKDAICTCAHPVVNEAEEIAASSVSCRLADLVIPRRLVKPSTAPAATWPFVERNGGARRSIMRESRRLIGAC